MKATVALLVVLFGIGFTASASAKDVPGAKGKLDTQVRALVQTQQDHQSVPAQAQQDRVTVDDDRVLVDVYVNGDVADAASQLSSAGMDVVAQADAGPASMVEGYVPVSRATDIASLDV